MKLGKITELVMKRSVIKRLVSRRQEVLFSVDVARDCAAIREEKGKATLLSSSSVTLEQGDIGVVAVQRAINDVLAGGGQAIGVMVTILLPANCREITIKRIVEQIEGECKASNIEVLQVHTQVTEAVKQAVVSVVGVGASKEELVSDIKKLKPGHELVMTKWAGLEGTVLLIEENFEKLKSRYTASFLLGAKELSKDNSVQRETEIASAQGAVYMKAVSERGIYGALWAIASSIDTGFEVELSNIPIRQETVEVAEFFDLNPYQLFSNGCLLIGVENGGELVECLQAEGICAAVIGRVTENKDKIIVRDGERFSLEPPKTDEYYLA